MLTVKLGNLTGLESASPFPRVEIAFLFGEAASGTGC